MCFLERAFSLRRMPGYYRFARRATRLVVHSEFAAVFSLAAPVSQLHASTRFHFSRSTPGGASRRSRPDALRHRRDHRFCPSRDPQRCEARGNGCRGCETPHEQQPGPADAGGRMADRRAANAAVAAGATILDHVDNQTYGAAIDASDAVVVLRERSLGESNGPLADALGRGRPILANRSGAIPEMAQNAAEYVELNIESIRAGMERLLDADRRTELEAAAGSADARSRRPVQRPGTQSCFAWCGSNGLGWLRVRQSRRSRLAQRRARRAIRRGRAPSVVRCRGDAGDTASAHYGSQVSPATT